MMTISQINNDEAEVSIEERAGNEEASLIERDDEDTPETLIQEQVADETQVI